MHCLTSSRTTEPEPAEGLAIVPVFKHDAVFWLTGAEEKLMYVSPAYEEIWGRSVESCYANDLAFLESVHPDDRESFAAALKTKKSGFGVEYRIVRPDGEIRWIHDRAFPICDADGNVVRIAGIAEDITARRALEQRLRHAQPVADRRSLFMCRPRRPTPRLSGRVSVKAARRATS